MGRRRLSQLVALLAMTAATGLQAIPASATSTPPWEPDPNTVGASGTLTFYNAAGDVVTSGSNIDHLFDYALASSDDPSTTKGTFSNLEFANPTPSVDTGNWPTSADESSAVSNGSAPGSLATATQPLVTLDSSGAELHAAMGSFTPNTTAGYQNVFQVRLYTTGPNSSGTGAALYWAADVLVQGTGNSATWTEVYPTNGSAPTATSIQLGASPVTSSTQGTTVTFTATETADDNTHPAGTMTFFDGNQYLGSSSGTAVDSNGVATVMTSTLIPGTHTIKADFTPDSASYSAAPEVTISYLVNPIAAKPTITGAVKVGYAVTCHEALTAGETVSFTWKLNGAPAHYGQTYVLPGLAYYRLLTCMATVNVPGGTASSSTSIAYRVALGNPLVFTIRPFLYSHNYHNAVIHGTYEYVSPGRWRPTAHSYSFQWYLGTSRIRGATTARFLIPRAYIGKLIRCLVVAHLPGYANGLAYTLYVRVAR